MSSGFAYINIMVLETPANNELYCTEWGKWSGTEPFSFWLSTFSPQSGSSMTGNAPEGMEIRKCKYVLNMQTLWISVPWNMHVLKTQQQSFLIIPNDIWQLVF